MKIYSLLIVSLLLVVDIDAQELKGFDNYLKTGIENLLNDYTKYAGLTQDGNAIDSGYVDSFISIFENKGESMVYNDIDPDKVTGEIMSVQNYLNYMMRNFLKGLLISIDLNQITIGKAYPFKNSRTYVVNVSLSKNLFGLYQNNQILDTAKSLIFQIVFNKKSERLENFRIHSIQSPEKATDFSTPREEKLVFGLSVTPQYTQIKSTNISNSNYWKNSGKVTINKGFELSYALNQRLSIKSGINYSIYKAAYSISNFKDRSTELTTDKDNDTYYKDIEADLNEINTLSMIEVPLLLKFTSKSKSNLRYFLFGGASLGYLFSSKFNVTGSATLKGYYPEYNVLLENIPEYGFESNTYDANEGNWELKDFYFLANFGIGVSIKVGYKSLLNIGPLINLSLNDFKYNHAKYKDDYYTLFGDPGKTTVNSYGLSISFLLY